MTAEALSMPEPATTRPKNTVSLGMLGGKLLTVALKLTKSTKLLFAFGTFTAYSFMFSWKFALLFMFGIGVHESGHVWAMRREKLKTRGFYFIPFFGGMAIPDEAFKNSRQETYIALMGPAFGIVTVSVPLVLSLYFKSHFWTAAASWLAFVNLFNLFPINPLDGGRVVKCIAMSLHRKTGVAILALGFIAAIYLAMHYHLGLLWFIAFIGMLEVPLLKMIIYEMLFFPAFLIILFVKFLKRGKMGFYEMWYSYLINIRLKFKDTMGDFQNEYWNLPSKDIKKFSLCFVAMIALFLAVILLLSGPGADITTNILKS